MPVAWLLTALAVAGAMAGALMGQVRALSYHFGAAGGGLLTGVAVFWLIPEIAERSGWTIAIVLAVFVCGVMLLLDRFLAHGEHAPGHAVMGPLLAAAAVHSFFDGWSVRVFFGHGLADVAVPIGLAMHKVPEGAALGWLTRKSLNSISKAVVVSAAVESVTLLGAFVEPRLNHSGVAEFGLWWTAVVLAIIAGGFLFLGCHALWLDRKRPRVLIVFLVTLAVMGIIRR